MNTDKTIPVEASADGKRNAHHINCREVGRCRPYAVCLYLCEKRKHGALATIYSDCSAIIGKKQCPAMRMRKEELAAGHSIYFEERNAIDPGLMDKAKQFVGTLLANVMPAAPAKPRPVASKKSGSIIDRIDDGNYADALNRAMQQVEVPKVEVKSGESLLEMARRMMKKD